MPEQKGAQSTDGDTDFICHLSDGFEFLGATFGGQVTFKVIVQFDAIKACVFSQLEAFAKAHAVGVGEGPKIDGLLHLIALWDARRSSFSLGAASVLAVEAAVTPATPIASCSARRRRLQRFHGQACPKVESACVSWYQSIRAIDKWQGFLVTSFSRCTQIGMAKASGMSTRIFALLLTTSLSLVAKPWNILVILSDDHRYDFLGFHENAPEFLETPHLDRLANEGATLPTPLSQLPVFSQSGLHTDRTIHAPSSSCR